MSVRSNIVAGLDVGTTKVCCIIGELNNEDEIEIIGLGTAVSRGIRKGVVVNIESTLRSVSEAIEQAERMAGVEIKEVYAGIAGSHISSLNSTGVIGVSRPDREITASDVERVIEAAKAVAIPMDREVIHVIPQEYIVDEQDGIKDPVGMSGVRLEAEVHIVTAAVTSAQNIIRSINRAGIAVADLVLEPLASSISILNEEEKEIGVVLVDIGGGTTDLAIFRDNSIRHTSVLALGGNHVTNDIALGLRTSKSDAEKLKIEHGCALTSLVEEDELIEVLGVGGRKSRPLPRQVLPEIIEPRMTEIFELVDQEIIKSGFKELAAAGMVITGGSSSLEGLSELAEKVVNVPVRVGIPDNVKGLIDVISTPAHATGVGLVRYGFENESEELTPIFNSRNMFEQVFSRMKSWITQFF